MAIVQRIMASGVPSGAAVNMTGDTSGALTAAGTTKATALQLSAAQSYLGTTAASTGVSLPQANQGDSIEVFNGGANTLLVYTPIGIADTITNQSANGGFSIATLRSAKFNKVSSTLWMVNYSA
jgi:hypothetical protein